MVDNLPRVVVPMVGGNYADDMVMIPGPVWMDERELDEHNLIANNAEVIYGTESENDEDDSGLGREVADQHIEE